MFDVPAHNSYYFDPDNICYASNLWPAPTFNPAPNPSVNIFSSSVKVKAFTLPAAVINNFWITDFHLGQNFKVQYIAACSAYFTFSLKVGKKTNLGVVHSDNNRKLFVSVPDISSFTVDNVYLHQSFDLYFTAVCPDAYCYGISVNDVSIQYPVTTDTTVTYDVPPCTDLTFTLYAKNCTDESDTGYSTSLWPYHTDPVPDITSFTVDNVNLAQSFDVHFTATCPDAYCFEISVNDVSIQYPVTTDTTVTYDVPLCSSSTFTLDVKNCADESYAGSPSSLPSYPTAGQVDGLNIFPYRPLGSCYAYSSRLTTQSDAKIRCTRNRLKLLDSRNNLIGYQFFGRLVKAWVDLSYNGVSWTWGDGSTLLSNDALLEPGYPSLPTIRQCAFLVTNTKRLRNGACTSNLAATLCIQ
ncbi:uncharacterized protein LOC108682965 [Hyalella azteca]|uniref:Uncharacterized protein LOC108682965 n=1 Tax=Hyalella azteca TaxID=294128 RepID=A0A979FW93_HYAAZ|nr:uncharacterized protein LOC108682965 [Hyalella azteca]